LVNLDVEVAEKAQNIRDYYSKTKDAISATITQPDAIHLASAISITNCECFYTFDGKDKRGKSRSLLPLNSTIAGKYYLKIAKPGYGESFQARIPGT
jgi:hypothetical protein